MSPTCPSVGHVCTTLRSLVPVWVGPDRLAMRNRELTLALVGGCLQRS